MLICMWYDEYSSAYEDLSEHVERRREIGHVSIAVRMRSSVCRAGASHAIVVCVDEGNVRVANPCQSQSGPCKPDVGKVRSVSGTRILLELTSAQSRPAVYVRIIDGLRGRLCVVYPDIPDGWIDRICACDIG